MTDKLRHYIGWKRSTYWRLKADKEDLRTQYNELARAVKRLTKEPKNNYEIKVASQAKMDPKRFFTFIR